MKKTSLRKNRFSAKRVRLPDNSPQRKLSRKLWRARVKAGGGAVEVGESRMDQLAFNDRDIVALLTAASGRPITPEVQAFYDRLFALTHGEKTKDDDTDPGLSNAA